MEIKRFKNMNSLYSNKMFTRLTGFIQEKCVFVCVHVCLQSISYNGTDAHVLLARGRFESHVCYKIQWIAAQRS